MSGIFVVYFVYFPYMLNLCWYTMQKEWHQSEESLLDLEGYFEAFVSSPVHTLEIVWRNQQGDLVGIGLVDVLPKGLSSVYYYWDPDYAEGQLGTLSILQEIELAKKNGKSLYYMGFLVSSCGKMAYKSQFSGAEVWCGTQWQPLPDRNLEKPEVQQFLDEAEKGADIADALHFPFHRAVRIFSQRG